MSRKAKTVPTAITEEDQRLIRQANAGDNDAMETLRRRFYTPNTPKYKTYQRLWWFLLAGGILCTTVSLIWRTLHPGDMFANGILIGSYVAIGAALFVYFTKLKKERERVYDAILHPKSKEEKRLQEWLFADEYARHADSKNKWKDMLLPN